PAGEIDAHDLGAERRRQRPHPEGLGSRHAVHRHSSFGASSPAPCFAEVYSPCSGRGDARQWYTASSLPRVSGKKKTVSTTVAKASPVTVPMAVARGIGPELRYPTSGGENAPTPRPTL